MPRTNRTLLSGYSYEVVFRAREGLPFPPHETVNGLIRGCLARTQRDDKVTLSHFVMMNNHCHLHVVPSKEQIGRFCAFYGEFQKKLTDSLRALLGKSRLSLWEERTSVMLVDSLTDVVHRLIYLYTNPAAAGLCDSIAEYPGVSSWGAFCACEPRVDASVSVAAPWFRAKALHEVAACFDGHHLDEAQDRALLTSLLEHPSTEAHTLVIAPFAWLSLYGISDRDEIEAIRQMVIKGVQEREAALRRSRKPMTKEELLATAFLAPHTPKKKERKLLVIASCKQRRLSLLATIKDIVSRCRSAYELLKQRVQNVPWPNGTFIPHLPPWHLWGTLSTTTITIASTGIAA